MLVVPAVPSSVGTVIQLFLLLFVCVLINKIILMLYCGGGDGALGGVMGVLGG
jgi:hypothetical protein